jgi:uncharacterized protein YneF (UPF0154 family)
MRPKPIPSLNQEQIKVLQEEMKRTPSKSDIERINRAKEILKGRSV